MKVLTEREQLANKIDELWKAERFNDNQIDIQRKKIEAIQNQWFFPNRTRLILLEYHKEEMEKTSRLLSEYRKYLGSVLENLKRIENEKGQGS